MPGRGFDKMMLKLKRLQGNVWGQNCFGAEVGEILHVVSNVIRTQYLGVFFLKNYDENCITHLNLFISEGG